jgi:hypothetical protein
MIGADMGMGGNAQANEESTEVVDHVEVGHVAPELHDDRLARMAVRDAKNLLVVFRGPVPGLLQSVHDCTSFHLGIIG